MGLNDVYVRGHILNMNQPPNIEYAYSLLLQDENQRETYAHISFSNDAYGFNG